MWELGGSPPPGRNTSHTRAFVGFVSVCEAQQVIEVKQVKK